MFPKESLQSLFFPKSLLIIMSFVPSGAADRSPPPPPNPPDPPPPLLNAVNTPMINPISALHSLQNSSQVVQEEEMQSESALTIKTTPTNPMSQRPGDKGAMSLLSWNCQGMGGCLDSSKMKLLAHIMASTKAQPKVFRGVFGSSPKVMLKSM